MTLLTDETHDPALRSWVASANEAASDFPIQNLPFGVVRRAGSAEAWRVGVAIGDMVVDLPAAASAGWIPGVDVALLHHSLSALMGASPEAWSSLRRGLSAALRDASPEGTRARASAGQVLVPLRDVEFDVPARGDYTDFYASVYHATNIGSMFRPDNPLLPNYKWVPIGYHGRSSSIVVSGTPVRRPVGQASAAPAGPPVVGPSRRLDYEVELGAWIGGRNALGTPTPIGRAGERLFGVSLLNDWSARDLQAWEYQPLGPFLAKNFASTVSPWVVSGAALAPFRIPAFARDAADPAPLPYLTDADDQARGGLDITIEVWLHTARMRAEGTSPVRISASQTRDLYWTVAQMIAHHTSGGCNLGPGDLLGSGTVSGPTRESRGCLQELAWRGTEPVALPNGEQRAFLEDGDEVVFRAVAQRDGFRRIGFGECRGVILPALT